MAAPDVPRDASAPDVAEQGGLGEPARRDAGAEARDASEADRLEQERAEEADDAEPTEGFPADVPEADALEQSQPVPMDDEPRES